MNRYINLAIAASLLAPLPSHADATAVATAAVDTRPALLRALDGNWIMDGDVRGEPVTYRMVASPALQGTFTELRMKDVQVPAQYEAAVFIGVDAASQGLTAHWIDSFGPKHSVPHGTGHIAGNALQFTIPYASGKFRDTFTYDPATTTWLFVLESGQPDGSWKHFARFAVKRQ